MYYHSVSPHRLSDKPQSRTVCLHAGFQTSATHSVSQWTFLASKLFRRPRGTQPCFRLHSRMHRRFRNGHLGDILWSWSTWCSGSGPFWPSGWSGHSGEPNHAFGFSLECLEGMATGTWWTLLWAWSTWCSGSGLFWPSNLRAGSEESNGAFGFALRCL